MQAALTAYEKDLEKQHGGLPISQQAKLSSTSQDSQLQILDDKKAKAHLEILQTIQNHQQKMEAKSQDGPPPPPPPSLWQQATTPDGHVYYYNVFTRGMCYVIVYSVIPTLDSVCLYNYTCMYVCHISFNIGH